LARTILYFQELIIDYAFCALDEVIKFDELDSATVNSKIFKYV